MLITYTKTELSTMLDDYLLSKEQKIIDEQKAEILYFADHVQQQLLQYLLPQINVSGSLPQYLETCKNGQSIVDTHLTGLIIATANQSIWADEIVRRWNIITDAGR